MCGLLKIILTKIRAQVSSGYLCEAEAPTKTTVETRKSEGILWTSSECVESIVLKKGDINMNVSEAVSDRILELCKEKCITVNKLSTLSGVTQSTVNDIVNRKAKNIGIITIKKLCDGFGISITEFFNTNTFCHLEQELY